MKACNFTSTVYANVIKVSLIHSSEVFRRTKTPHHTKLSGSFAFPNCLCLSQSVAAFSIFFYIKYSAVLCRLKLIYAIYILHLCVCECERFLLLQRFNTLRVNQSHNFENRIDWLESALAGWQTIYSYIYPPKHMTDDFNMNFDLAVHFYSIYHRVEHRHTAYTNHQIILITGALETPTDEKSSSSSNSNLCNEHSDFWNMVHKKNGPISTNNA